MLYALENGTSTSACSDTYGGPSVFSEVETASMASFIRTIGSSLDVFLSFHSYSQLLLIPYGHSTAPLDNYDDTVSTTLISFSNKNRFHYDVILYIYIFTRCARVLIRFPN